MGTDDWLRFDEHSPKGRPQRDVPAHEGGNRAVDLRGLLDTAPAAKGYWNKPLPAKQFEEGKHLGVITRCEWRRGSSGREFLSIVWRDYKSKRGAVISTPCFLNAPREEGRTWAFRQLFLIAAAVGIEIDINEFQPSVLLGGVASLTIEKRPPWTGQGEPVPTVIRYETAGEV